MDARTERMVGLFRTGNTLQQIGDEYGITRERVRQIISRAGIKREDGGVFMRTFLNARYKEQKNRGGRYHITYGCSKEDAERLNGGMKVTTKKSPAQRYAMQRKNAKARGVEWAITFPEWLEIWMESGHFDERGRGQGYCMARYGDSGPYSPGNVEIITIGQNFSDSYIVHPWKERFAATLRKRKDVCVRGHKRTPENISRFGSCKECDRIRSRQYRQRKLFTAGTPVSPAESSLT